MSVNLVNKTTGELSLIAGGTLYADCPLGTIIPFGGSTMPKGYLLCDGSEVSKTTYEDLYNIIGDSFGTASDNTKFVLPDLRESVPVGSGTRSSGVSAHDTYTVGQFKDDQMQNVEGSFTAYSYSDGLAGGVFSSNIDNPNVLMGGTTPTLNFDDFNFSLSNVARTGTTTHGKQLGVNFIIKAIQLPLPLEFENAIDDVKEDVASLTTRVTGVENGVTSLTTRVGNTEGNITSLSTRVSNTEGNVTSLTTRVGNVEGNVTSLTTRVSGVENNVESITPTVLTKTLAVGATSLTFTDSSITNTSRIIIYTNPYSQGVVTGATQSGTTVTVTCAAQTSAYKVCIEIRN